MTYDDEDEPTNPGIGGPNVSLPALAASAQDDERPTVPAPAPERLDPAPRKLAKPPPLPQIDRALEAFEASPEPDPEDRTTTPLLAHEAETWRPPPPAAKEREEAMAAVMSVAAAKPSSIAPREVARKEPPPRKSSGALIALGMLALLGAGVLYRQNALQSRSAAASTAPQPAAQEHVAIAPKETHLVATEPVRTAPPEPAPVPAEADVVPSEAPPAVDRPVPAIAEQARAPRSPRKAKTTELTPGELPEEPSRKSIGDALASLRADFATCAGGKPGVAELDLTLNGNGSVSHAIVGGDFAGSPQGSCIARTVRRAHVAPFQQPKFRVLYRLGL